MDIFGKTDAKDKASNVTGGQLLKTSINWAKETIHHEYQKQNRDSEGDIIGNHNGHETINLTPEEFAVWITDSMKQASLDRLLLALNPPVVEEDPEAVEEDPEV
jgi:hypothetical protein